MSSGGGLPAVEKTDRLPENFVWTEDNDFYYGPVTCGQLHYRTAAIVVGVAEVVILSIAVASFIGLHVRNASVDLWVTVGISVVLVFAIFTTITMFYGIFTEQARLIYPQIAFLQVEISLLMFGALISIVSMSMGIHTTHQLFGIFVNDVFLVRHETRGQDDQTVRVVGGIIHIGRTSTMAPESLREGWQKQNTHSNRAFRNPRKNALDHTDKTCRVNEMETDFGPIWPFNMSVLAFFSAALGIWFHIIVKGCYDFILDKEHFTNAPNIELKVGAVENDE